MKLDPTRAPGLAGWIAIAVLVGLPTTGVGFFGEDLMTLLVLEGRAGDWVDISATGDTAPSLGSVAGEPRPWWATRPIRRGLPRPVAAGSLALDHALYGLDALGYHVTHVALFAVVLLLAVLTLRELTRDRVGALLAGLVFSLDEVHSVAIAHVSARHALLGAAFGLGAWLLHRRGRRWSSLVLLALALLCSETASLLGAWFVAEAFALREGSLADRARACGPAAALSLVGALAYASATGLPPLERVGRALSVDLPILLGALLMPVRPERLTEAAGGEMLAVGCGLAIVALLAFGRALWREDPAARFAVIGVGLSVPCLALGEASSVGLLLPSVLSAYLLAGLIRHSWHAASLARPLSAALIAIHLVLAPALHLRASAELALRSARGERAAASVPRLPDARVLLLTSPDGVDATLPLRVMLGPSPPAGVWVMSLSLESHGLWLSDDGVLGLSGDLLIRERERRWLDAPLAVGERRRRGALEVVVREATARHVTKVDVALDVPASEVVLLARVGDGYRAVALPDRGGAVTLPRADAPAPR